MEPDGHAAEGTKVGGELNISRRNDMMPGERSGQNDVTAFERVTPLDNVL